MLTREVEVLRGCDAVAARAQQIGALHRAINTPFDARLDLLAIWARIHPDREVTAIASYGPDGALDGFAPLALRAMGPLRSAVAVGQGYADHSSVVWRDASAATALGDAVRRQLGALGRPWQLWLERLPSGPELDAFTHTLGAVHELEPGPEAPQVVLGCDRELRRYESVNTRKSLARMHNRIRRDGRVLAVEVASDADTIRRALPAVLQAHRERDLQLRGWSALDATITRDHYLGVVETLTRHGAIRLLTVRIDGELAAYVVAIADGDTLRIYDNRVVPAYLEYSAGAIANSEILRFALAEPSLGLLDWGVGDARYKHSSATRSRPTHNLAAWSGRPIRRAWRAGTHVARRSRDVRERMHARR